MLPDIVCDELTKNILRQEIHLHKLVILISVVVTAGMAPVAPVMPVAMNVPDLPNNILFLQNLPQETTKIMLSMLFQQ